MKVKRILRKLNYLPRWAWYLLSLGIGGPVGPFVVYLAFHVLDRMAEDEAEDERQNAYAWDVDIDRDGVHVRGRSSQQGARDSQAAGSYRDEECIVTGEDEADVRDQWQRTESSARRAASAEPAKAADTAPAGEGDVDDVIREGRDALRRIRRANDLIPDPALSAQIDSIENSCGQILSILEQRPQLLAQLRTFLRYYLPTTIKLLDARARLENTASTPKAREVRMRISEALGVIDKAFQRQVEALDEYRFIDLESEMDVLRDMLRADGLVDDGPAAQEDDPFAEVLRAAPASSSGKDSRNVPLAGH